MLFQSYRQQGIALIQILLITAVLSVLALYLTSTAKNQVKMAQWADNKAKALVAVHSAESNLLFTLLVNNRHDEQVHTENNFNEIKTKWNFFAKPFRINDQVTVKIQDQAALIHAHYPERDLLKALIAFHGMSADQVNVVLDSLLDWQDLDNIPRANGEESLANINEIRNGSVPSLHDFNFINNISPPLFQSLLLNTTIYKKGIFNPMNSSAELLAAITSPNIAKQVVTLRENKQLTSSIFTQLTGITENVKIIMYPSNIVAIDIEGKVGNSIVNKQIIIELKPYANAYQRPFNIVSKRG